MRVIGVHPVEAAQPVHLVVLDCEGRSGELDWTSITQPDLKQDESFWQVPYDEVQVPGGGDRWTFFFHYLDVARPLQSNLGVLPLVSQTPMPQQFRFRKYEEP